MLKLFLGFDQQATYSCLVQHPGNTPHTPSTRAVPLVIATLKEDEYSAFWAGLGLTLACGWGWQWWWVAQGSYSAVPYQGEKESQDLYGVLTQKGRNLLEWKVVCEAPGTGLGTLYFWSHASFCSFLRSLHTCLLFLAPGPTCLFREAVLDAVSTWHPPLTHSHLAPFES